MMRCFLTIGTVGMLAFGGWAAGGEEIYGFKGQASQAQRELESKYDTRIDAQLMKEWMRLMTTRPHHSGSPKAKENAEWAAGKFREWGYEARLEVFHVLIPHPETRELTLLEPERWTASLKEGPVEGDSAAEAIREEGLPPYNAFSADGDVTAELVYVNQGLPRDYHQLERRGVDVRGKIVLARYGGSWRGIKPKVAAEMGAVGCIIFNDPKADGFYQGEAYPEGPFKHEDSVQRGSVLDLPKRPGDPLTPGRGATEDAERLSREEADNVMSIPVLPISYADALPLMRALGGPVAPESWRGAMPVTYHIGPGPAKVRLHLEFDWDLVPAYNVVATLRGSEQPDQWVIRGNHHDAWVVGARDPISGAVALMAEARAAARLARDGWRPRRTLIYALWDAEEPALLGSTEWAEHHAEELREKAVAYINTDGNSRGFLRIGGSHALQRLANQAAREVEDPQTGASVAERLHSRRVANADPGEKPSSEIRLSALGSGSDYSAFLQHLGVPSFNVSFGGEARSGEYHTMFDTFDFYVQHIDPGLQYGPVLSKVCGRLSLRLANAPVLPFDFTATSEAVSGYLSEVIKLADAEREAAARRNRLIEQGHYARASDPQDELRPPEPREPVPFFNFAPLQSAQRELAEAAKRWRKAYWNWASSDGDIPPQRLEQVNTLLYESEERFLAQGLPRRPWFRHQIYAPGLYTGYGVKTLPGVREAIEEGHWEEAQEQIEVTASAIESFAEQVLKAADLLSETATRR